MKLGSLAPFASTYSTSKQTSILFMMKRLPQILILLALAWACYQVWGPVKGREPAFLADPLSAKERAKRTGKPLVLVFSASWCGPCVYMKKRVYPSEEVQPFHEKFLWAYVDVDSPENRPLAAAAGVTGIPHIQLFSASGVDLGSVIGQCSAEEFAATLARAHAQP